MLRFVSCLLAAIAPAVASAAAPEAVPVTGYLTDDQGLPVDGSVTLHLKLYRASGPAIWFEDRTIDIDQGQFTVYLGEVTALPLSTFRDEGTLFLGLAIDTGPEMSPRLQVATAPYAGFAQYCEDASTVGGIDPADLALTGDPVDWTDLTNIPGDVADGDANTTYTAGTGLTLTGTTFAADAAAIDSMARAAAYDDVSELRAQLDTVYHPLTTCTVGQVLSANAQGNLVCTNPTTLPISEAAVDAAVANNGYLTSVPPDTGLFGGPTRVTLSADMTGLNGPQTALTSNVTMPAAGGPFRVMVSYGVRGDCGACTAGTFWVEDNLTSPTRFAAQSSHNAGGPMQASGFEVSPVTYANGQVVQFRLRGAGFVNGRFYALDNAGQSIPATWMSLQVVTTR